MQHFTLQHSKEKASRKTFPHPLAEPHIFPQDNNIVLLTEDSGRWEVSPTGLCLAVGRGLISSLLGTEYLLSLGEKLSKAMISFKRVSMRWCTSPMLFIDVLLCTPSLML